MSNRKGTLNLDIDIEKPPQAYQLEPAPIINATNTNFQIQPIIKTNQYVSKSYNQQYLQPAKPKNNKFIKHLIILLVVAGVGVGIYFLTKKL